MQCIAMFAYVITHLVSHQVLLAFRMLMHILDQILDSQSNALVRYGAKQSV